MNQKPKRGMDNDGMTKGGTKDKRMLGSTKRQVNGTQAKPMDPDKGTQVWYLGPSQVIHGPPGETEDLPNGTKDVGTRTGKLTMTDHFYRIWTSQVSMETRKSLRHTGTQSST